MTDPLSVPDLNALSAKLRQDDEAFRRSFALGRLTGGGAAEVPERGAALRTRFLSLVENRLGIDAASGADRVDRLLASMPAAALPAWLMALEQEPVDGPGWEALIDILTVHETYFFRDPEQLAVLRRTVLPELIAARRGDAAPRLVVWCAGCSSGEEVYTLAMLIADALCEAGEAEPQGNGVIAIAPRWRISVLGTDVDRAVLREAEAGCYADFPMGPFRSLPEAWSGYFEPGPAPPLYGGPAERVVRPEIRALASFQAHNLAAAEPPARDAALVVCRNVLMYLSDRARRHVETLFHRALGAGGILALGPTDTLRQPDLFQPQWSASTVLYRKK